VFEEYIVFLKKIDKKLSEKEKYNKKHNINKKPVLSKRDEIIFCIKAAVAGLNSDGFKIAALPAAIACTKGQMDRLKG
jgi:hypothetical protein